MCCCCFFVVCANVTYAPQRQQLLLEVLFDEKSSSKYGISARNPSPLCIPIMMGIPMAMCVQMSDIAIKGNNLNMCMDFVVRLATTDLFEMHFQCMRMGLDGIQYLDKDGKPVIPSGNLKTEDDYYDDETAIDVLPVQNYNDTNDNAFDNEIDIDGEKVDEAVQKPLKKTHTDVENEISKKDQINTKEEVSEDSEENGSLQEGNDEEQEEEAATEEGEVDEEDVVQNMVEDLDNVNVNNDEILTSEELNEESFENYTEDEENNNKAVAETHEIPRPMTINSMSEEVKGTTTELNDLEITLSNEVNPVMTAINANDSKSEVIEVITTSTTETSELEMTTTFNDAQPALLSGYHSNDSQVSVTSSILSTAENVHKLAVNKSPAPTTDILSNVSETPKVAERRSLASLQHKTQPVTNSITFYKRLLGII